MMRVLHVITGLGQGGAEAVLFRLIQTSSSPDMHTVVSMRDEGFYGERLRSLGASVSALEIGSQRGFLSAFFKLRQVVRDVAPDVIQTWMYHADLLGGLVGRIEQVPVVWGLHNSNFEKKHTKSLTRKVVGLCAVLSRFVPRKIVTCSNVARALHEEIGYCRSKFKLIQNGVSVGEFARDVDAGSDVRRLLGIPENHLVYVNVARFHPQKDHGNLIEAFERAFSDRDDVHLILCGAGVSADNRDFSTLLRDRKSVGRIHCLGSRSDVAKILSGSDYFVLSSLGEAFPCSIVEAMASELPCIVTDVGDCSEIVGDTGWAVSACSPTQLESALRTTSQITTEKRAEIGERARSRVIENYTIEKMSKEYDVIWREVCKGLAL